MKRLLGLMMLMFASLNPVMAQSPFSFPSSSSQSSGKASMTFRNQSDYTMTLRIIYASGGFYNKIVLYPHSYQTVYFSSSNNFKLKIKATSSLGQSSYHDGGKFSVTSNSREYSEGEMTFKLSSYGNGLGPSISAKQFESDY